MDQVGERLQLRPRLGRLLNENCERVENEYLMLKGILPATLKTLGTEYVFADYMKGWTSQKGVPLPRP